MSFDVTVSLFTSHSGPCLTPELPKSVESTEGGLMEMTALLRHSAISVCTPDNEVEVSLIILLFTESSFFTLITDYLHPCLCHYTVCGHLWQDFISSSSEAM